MDKCYICVKNKSFSPHTFSKVTYFYKSSLWWGKKPHWFYHRLLAFWTATLLFSTAIYNACLVICVVIGFPRTPSIPQYSTLPYCSEGDGSRLVVSLIVHPAASCQGALWKPAPMTGVMGILGCGKVEESCSHHCDPPPGGGCRQGYCH